MRIVLPITDGQIPNHFGRAARFLLAEIEAGAVVRTSEHENPGHGPGGPPPLFVVGLGPDEVVAWGMPPHARERLEAAGVRVIVGARGDARGALAAHLAGTLRLTDERLDGGGCCHDEEPHEHPQPPRRLLPVQ